jgi:hypothetical protein
MLRDDFSERINRVIRGFAVLILRAAGGKIWAWRLWTWTPSRRWASLLFVLGVSRCVLFPLVALRIHYGFSYLILRQRTNPFRTRNLTTLYFAQLPRPTAKSQLQEVEHLQGVGGNVSFPSQRNPTRLPVSNNIRFYGLNSPFNLLNAILYKQCRTTSRLMVLMHSWLIKGLVDSCLKANSHTPCRSHAAPMSFPCHAVPLRV